MYSGILLKEEIEYIIKSFKEKKTFSQISKHLNRSPINIKNELYKYIKEKNHSGTSIYSLSKEFNYTLEKIKKIIDGTKLPETSYLEKKKVDDICELLKTKKKYGDIAKLHDTTKDTVILYFKRTLKEQVDKGLTRNDISKIYNLKNNDIDKLLGSTKTVLKIKKKSKLEMLEEENKLLKELVNKLKQKQIDY